MIDCVFAREQAELRPLGHGCDGYVEKAVRAKAKPADERAI